MSFGELALPEEQIQERNMEVVRLRAEGKTAQYIQSETGVPAKLQREILSEFQSFVRQDLWSAQRSKEIVGMMDVHFTGIIEKLYEAVESADMSDDYKAKAQILKNISEVETKRVEALQKAGVLSAQTIGDEVAEMQQRQESIIKILKETATKFPEAGKFIAEQIAMLNGEVVATRVGNE